MNRSPRHTRNTRKRRRGNHFGRHVAASPPCPHRTSPSSARLSQPPAAAKRGCNVSRDKPAWVFRRRAGQAGGSRVIVGCWVGGRGGLPSDVVGRGFGLGRSGSAERWDGVWASNAHRRRGAGRSGRCCPEVRSGAVGVRWVSQSLRSGKWGAPTRHVSIRSVRANAAGSMRPAVSVWGRFRSPWRWRPSGRGRGGGSWRCGGRRRGSADGNRRA